MTDDSVATTDREDRTGGGGCETNAADSDTTSNRRQFIALGATATTMLLAGCSGDDSDSENGDTNGSENGDANGGENGDANGSENGDANGGENGDANGGENGDANGGENGDANGGENGGENGEENGGAASASFEVSIRNAPDEIDTGETVTIEYSVVNAGDAEGTETVAFTVDGEQQSSESVTLGGGGETTGTFTYEAGDEPSEDVSFGISTGDDETESTVNIVTGGSVGGDLSSEEFFGRLAATTNFRFEISSPEGDSTGRANGGNFYLESMDRGNEFYLVDGTTYNVQGDQCFEVDTNIGAPEVEPENPADPVVTYVGSDTIEGDSVEVYEVEYPNETFRTTTTYYVLPSGRVRRTETSDTTTDFFDWGNADPVSAPDLNCQSLGDIGSDDGFGGSDDGGFGGGY
jgi:hypothetical protein